MKRRAKGIILAVIVSSSIACAPRRTCVTPGDSGTIEMEIQNKAPSDGALEGVTLLPSVQPPSLAPFVHASSTTAQDIGVGESKKFSVAYSVDRSLPSCGSSCEFSISLHTDMITVGSQPDLTDPKQDTVSRFIVKGSCPGEKKDRALTSRSADARQ